MSHRPRVTALRLEIERKNRVIRALSERVDVQARYITTIERKLTELAYPEPAPAPEPPAEMAKGAGQ